MHYTMKEVLEKTNNFIEKRGIVNEDTQQDLYLKVIEKFNKSNGYFSNFLSSIETFYNSIQRKNEKNKELYLEDIIYSNDFDLDEYSFEEELKKLLIRFEIMNFLNSKKVLDSLNERELLVLKLRFFRNLTLKEISEYTHVCAEGNRMIEAKALRKLRNPIRSKNIKYLLEL